MHPRLCSMALFMSTLCASCSQKHTEGLRALPTTHVMYSSALKTLLPLPYPALRTWLQGGVLVSTAQPRNARWRGEAIFAGAAPWLSTTCWDKSGTCWGCPQLQLLPSLDSLRRRGGLFFPRSRTRPCPSGPPQGTHGRSLCLQLLPPAGDLHSGAACSEGRGKLYLSGAGRGPGGCRPMCTQHPWKIHPVRGRMLGGQVSCTARCRFLLSALLQTFSLSLLISQQPSECDRVQASLAPLRSHSHCLHSGPSMALVPAHPSLPAPCGWHGVPLPPSSAPPVLRG